jgi:hypothetical protein
MKPKIKYENTNRNYKKGNGMEQRPENDQNYYADMIQTFKGSQLSSRDNTVKLLNSINKDKNNNFIDSDDEVYTSKSNTSSSDSDYTVSQSSNLDTENNTKTENQSSLNNLNNNNDNDNDNNNDNDNETGIKNNKQLINQNEYSQINQNNLKSSLEKYNDDINNNNNEVITTQKENKDKRKEINGEESNTEIKKRKTQTFREWMNKPKSNSSKSNSSSEESNSEKVSMIEESSYFNKPTILSSKMEIGIKKNEGN